MNILFMLITLSVIIIIGCIIVFTVIRPKEKQQYTKLWVWIAIIILVYMFGYWIQFD